MEKLSAAFLLPVYNGEKTISKTIKSIINQDYKLFKLIIINNGSTDKTKQILNFFAKNDNRITIYNLKKACLTKSLCYGINKIKEDLIIRIDADDICEKDRLRKTIKYMVNNQKCNISYCNFENIYSNTSTTIETPQKITSQDIIFHNPLAHSTYCLRRESLNKVKLNYSGIEGYQEYFGPSQDLMLISSAIFNFNFNISKVEGTKVLIIKNHDSISSRQGKKQKTNAAKILLVNSLISLLRTNTIQKKTQSLVCLSINLLRLCYHKTNLIITLKILIVTTCFHLQKKHIDYSLILSI